MKFWLLQTAVSLDQLANAIAGGWADETLSARAYRLRLTRPRWAAAYRAFNAVFFWQDDHCQSAYEAERLRLQAPPSERP